jgi:hypothetical protein
MPARSTSGSPLPGPAATRARSWGLNALARRARRGGRGAACGGRPGGREQENDRVFGRRRQTKKKGRRKRGKKNKGEKSKENIFKKYLAAFIFLKNECKN